ncbi:MAG TPA: bifunctional precorrin-2 dehydrogenase/sirohydrochlorin ferrochelatase [Methylomirabilota bacterium]|nr:bifunctional precorrin-2 dehydrogenase/sirohydrochlorin ferrochelatase [Methylomirabilota bacterium]
MAGHYPVFLDVTGRRCAVIGGGPVAERKVAGLIEAGARVSVIAPALTGRLAEWARQQAIRHVAREYRRGDLAGHRLVFIAADREAVTEAVTREARERGIWVNAADDPARCDFILPGVVRRGLLTVAVSSGGSSPALTRAIREELEGYFTKDYTLLARVTAAAREELRRRGETATAEAWQRALGGDLRRLVAVGREREAKARLLEQLRSEACR